MNRIITTDHERVGRWVQAHGGGYYREGTKCLGLEKNGELVAGVLYDYHNGASVYMHVAGKGLWAIPDFLWICFDYPFNQLKCNVVIGLVSEKNMRARNFDEHLGFKLTARIPEGHPDGNLLIYTMRRKDCRWLKESNGQAIRTAIA